MPTELPIAAAPTSAPSPTSTIATATAPGTAGVDASLANADLQAETQTFMAMLSQLLDEGAVVVAAPTQALQTTQKSDATETETTPGEVLGAAPVDDSLLSLLIPAQAPVAPAGTSAPTANTLDAARRPAMDSLPLMAANAATLQKAVGKAAAETSKVTMEFQTTLSAQAADALLTGADKALAETDMESPLLATDTTGRATASQTLQSAAGHALPRTQLPMESRVGTPAWADELAAKATFVHERGMQSASLRLSPEHLGPMEIQISVQDDKASVWFGAAHAETRAALEQALPRLREMLSSQGLMLSDAGVFREPPRDQARAYTAVRSDAAAPEVDEREVVIGKRNVLLDAYA
jgi:flagellar hook-length control protein FliK